MILLKPVSDILHFFFVHTLPVSMLKLLWSPDVDPLCGVFGRKQDICAYMSAMKQALLIWMVKGSWPCTSSCLLSRNCLQLSRITGKLKQANAAL